jgi:hypothetical protein
MGLESRAYPDREDTAQMLEPIPGPPGIKVSVDELPMLEEARNALMAYLSGP